MYIYHGCIQEGVWVSHPLTKYMQKKMAGSL
jgi:hypothetical protein